MDLCIFINSNCNLNCIYCFENKSFETFDYVATVKKISKIALSSPNEPLNIKLHGGEPFLIFPRLKALCESIWKQYPKVQFRTTTNGTFVHGEIQNWLLVNRERFRIKLSLDGCEEAHNINRSKSFRLIDIKFFSTKLKSVTVNMTISPQTLHLLYKSVVFLHNCGFREIRPNFQELCNWDNPVLLRIFYEQMQLLSSFYENAKLDKFCKLFDIHFERAKDTSEEYYPCTIGAKRAFDITGTLSRPCHWFFENVASEEMINKAMNIDFDKPSLLREGRCKMCAFVNICHTCYAANLKYRGSVKKRDLGLCKLQKLQFLIVADFQSRMFQSNDVIKLALKNLQMELSQLEYEKNFLF